MTGLVVAIACFLAASPRAQDTHPHAPARSDKQPPATLRSGLGSYHHPITTTSAEARQFFDQGLTLVYGLNHGGAIRRFRRAAERDPSAPRPLWGVALALGPHINNPDIDPDAEKSAAETIERARQLAAKTGTAAERAYIDALTVRYSTEP